MVPDRIGPVQIFKVTGPVGPFFGWTVRSLLTGEWRGLIKASFYQKSSDVENMTD